MIMPASTPEELRACIAADAQTSPSTFLADDSLAGMEPLCAIYSKRCLITAENHIKQNKLKIQRALGNHRLKKIPETVLRSKDPELRSFFNINTPQDLARAEEMAAGDGEQGA